MYLFGLLIDGREGKKPKERWRWSVDESGRLEKRASVWGEEIDVKGRTMASFK